VSDKSDDFLSFEKALRELKMRSEELKKLVSEGEIRAFRDGDSMKFRSEDVQALRSKASGDAELSFADSLEDDTGMVTEQLSDEDTLLADDEVEEEKPAKRAAAGRPSRQAPVAVGAGAAKDPIWLTIAGILCTVIMLWGCMVSYSVAKERNPKENPLTSVWADKAAK
jgi:hypothetical protein